MKSKRPFNYSAALSTFDKAKTLRKDSTPAEKQLWKMIRNRDVKGFKFRRQHPLLYFVADFYCHEALLVVELDGSIHELEDVKQYDKQREEKIIALGITVLRFTNEEVFAEPEMVIKKIEEHLSLTLHPSPAGRGMQGEGFPVDHSVPSEIIPFNIF